MSQSLLARPHIRSNYLSQHLEKGKGRGMRRWAPGTNRRRGRRDGNPAPHPLCMSESFSRTRQPIQQIKRRRRVMNIARNHAVFFVDDRTANTTELYCDHAFGILRSVVPAL